MSQTGITAPHWIRLTRNAAHVFSVTHSADGVTWEPVQGSIDQTILMSAPSVYIGLAVTAHNAAATCEAKFSNVTMTGNISGSWEHQDIGIKSNAADRLYVALNGTAVIYHADPKILQTNQWTEWRIALSEFAKLGVKLTKVASIALGTGTKGNTTAPGGSGTLFFDDIRLYRPAKAVSQ
jgi:hypothetical protein